MKTNQFLTILLLAVISYGPQSLANTKDLSYYGPKNQRKDYVKILVREIEKRDAYKERFYKLSEKQKEDSREKAKLYYQKGRELFDAEKITKAQKYFGKAIYLDPLTVEYNYDLAIAAYRNKQYTHSLALLEIVNGSNIDPTEISYYEALNNMKLRDTESAIKIFGEVVQLSDPQLSPSAAMYRGLLLKDRRRYEEAKQTLQYILDNSQDSNLDKAAERQIEEIIALQRFEEESKKRFAFQVYGGALYDSNVLNIADNNSTSDLSAYRMLYGGNFEYKALHRQNHSLTPRISASDIYSFDKSFGSDATIQSTDPLQFEIAAPYTYRFLLGNTPSAWTLTPTYSNLFMSLNESGREKIYSTMAVSSDLTTRFFESWVNSVRIDLANDTFHPLSTPENDQSAMKYGLTLANTKLFDAKGSKSMSFDLSYLKNDADGVNSLYNRIIVSVGGTYPLSEKWTSYGKLDYLDQDFNKSLTNRADNGFIATLGGFYPLSQKLNLNIYGQFQENNSTVTIYDFSKFSLMTMISYSSGFF